MLRDRSVSSAETAVQTDNGAVGGRPNRSTAMGHPASTVSTPRLKPDVVFRRLDDGGVLVDLSTNQIFELNHTAARTWELLAGRETLPGIADQLAAEFDVDANTAAEQVDNLLHDLESEGLLER